MPPAVKNFGGAWGFFEVVHGGFFGGALRSKKHSFQNLKIFEVVNTYRKRMGNYGQGRTSDSNKAQY